jgi:hypothetical protein
MNNVELANKVTTRCNHLKSFWEPRNTAMKRWYRLIEMIDELKTEKMESFVGNDPRALYNLVLHLLDTEIPHRIKDYDMADLDAVAAVAEVGRYFKKHWKDAHTTFRRSNPRQSLNRTFIGFMLATGWYAMLSMMSDDGKRTYKEPLNPMEVYPMWDAMLGLSEVARVYKISSLQAVHLAQRNNWAFSNPFDQWVRSVGQEVNIYDYWWIEISDVFPYIDTVWNAVVIGSDLVKYEQTRFKRIPIYIAPVGGLPDMGSLTDGSSISQVYSSTLKLQQQHEVSGVSTDRWKAELGQSILATNENVYRTWNKWWSFSLQLLRDTAQPRIFERSRSGKAIVKPEDVFRRGAIFRGGPDDSVEFIGTPPIPLELRSTQLDLEAMMQRGGVSWAMHGAVAGQITAYVMSQIAASANQVMKPFHQAVIDALSDMDNDDLADIRNRGIKPYGWEYPDGLPEDIEVSADYKVEIPGDLVQRATTARMLDPDFRLSYSYVMSRLFPDIEDSMKERAQVRADQAELHPSNSLIALVQYYRKQAAYLASDKVRDIEGSRLYEAMAELAFQQLMPPSSEETTGRVPGMARPEATPQLPTGRRIRATEVAEG